MVMVLQTLSKCFIFYFLSGDWNFMFEDLDDWKSVLHFLSNYVLLLTLESKYPPFSGVILSQNSSLNVVHVSLWKKNKNFKKQKQKSNGGEVRRGQIRFFFLLNNIFFLSNLIIIFSLHVARGKRINWLLYKWKILCKKSYFILRKISYFIKSCFCS